MDAGVLQLHGLTDEAEFDAAFTARLQSRAAPIVRHDSVVEHLLPVSLVIPTFLNEQMKNGVLQRLLAGIEQAESIRQVVLVQARLDGHDDSPEAELGRQVESQLQAAGKAIVWISCEPNRRGAARNLGAAAATEELLMYLDDDMLLTNWRLVDVVVSRMLEGEFDAAMFPPRHYARYPQVFTPVELSKAVDDWRRDPLNVNPELIFDPITEGVKFQTMGFCFPGCFMVIRRDAYKRAGGFADFEGWGFEDTFMAIEAARKLRILNLFQTCEPLLHIDHAVTPYKSWEYGSNKDVFFSQQTPEITAELHRRVLSGQNLTSSSEKGRRSAPAAVIEDLILQGLPAGLLTVLPTMSRVADELAIDGLASDPAFTVLTGSRGRKESRPDSDFDILMLFRHGRVREFVVTEGDDGKRVDLELADLNKFETISVAPAFFGFTGALELSKLAGVTLLNGDSEAFEQWSRQVLGTALRCGRAYWMMFLAGQYLQPNKMTSVRPLLLTSMRQIIRHVSHDTCERDLKMLNILESGQLSAAAAPLTDLLDYEVRDWRLDMTLGQRAFANQVPEIWLALNWLWRTSRKN